MRPLPAEVNTVIDLTNPDTTVGHCNWPVETFDPAEHTVLPSDRDAYPLVVHVSAEGFDQTCGTCRLGEPVETTYGVALSLPFEFWQEFDVAPILAVNEPWSIVAGGCGEACAISCLEGYQEFARTTCLGSYAREFGIATNVEDPPDAYLVVDLAPANAIPCCPYDCGI